VKLVVLGASGGIGQWVVRTAAKAGHSVTAVGRSTSLIPTVPGVLQRRGEITDPAFLEEAIDGHSAVVSCVGLRRGGLSPFARLLSPPDLMTRLASSLARAMESRNVRRVVLISAGGVGDSFARLSWPVQQLVGAGNIAVAYRDLAGMEARFAASSLDWLAVRPVTLTWGAPRGRARPVDRYELLSTVRRSDVAGWVVKAAVGHDVFTAHDVLLGAQSE
jgi:nucleoside-diphosphate-sugar epimerase